MADNLATNIRTGYQVAASLYMQENALTWARFNAMLTANGILITATTFAFREGLPALLLALILPVVGLFLSVTWKRMMSRGFEYTDTWRASTLALERHYFAERVETLQRAEVLRSSTPGQGTPRARDAALRVISIFRFVYALIVLLAAIEVGYPYFDEVRDWLCALLLGPVSYG